MLFKRDPVEIIKDERVVELLKEQAATAVTAVIEKLHYKSPVETPEYLAVEEDKNRYLAQLRKLQDDHALLVARYQKLQEDATRLGSEHEQLRNWSAKAQEDLHYADQQRQLLEKRSTEAEFKLAQLGGRAREAAQLFARHREVFEELKSKPRLYLAMVETEEDLNFETFVLVTPLWEKLLILHKFIVSSLRKEWRAASDLELNLVRLMLEAINLPNLDKVELIEPQPGEALDNDLHSAIAKEGEVVVECLLPGLVSAKGKLAAKALVRTSNSLEENTLL